MHSIPPPPLLLHFTSTSKLTLSIVYRGISGHCSHALSAIGTPGPRPAPEPNMHIISAFNQAWVKLVKAEQVSFLLMRFTEHTLGVPQAIHLQMLKRHNNKLVNFPTLAKLYKTGCAEPRAKMTHVPQSPPPLVFSV